jgi:hypothetical protein
MKSAIVALFTSTEEVDRALAALGRAGIQEMNSQLIENLSQDGPDVPDAKAPSLASDRGWSDQPAPRYIESDLLAELGLNDDEIAFYSQGMEMGGQLLVIRVDEKDLDRARQIVTEHDGDIFARE